MRRRLKRRDALPKIKINKTKYLDKQFLAKVTTSNPAEQRVLSRLLRAGFAVFRKGWPDFIAIKNGNVVAVEVRQGKDRLSGAQMGVLNILKTLGAQTFVAHLDKDFEMTMQEIEKIGK